MSLIAIDSLDNLSLGNISDIPNQLETADLELEAFIPIQYLEITSKVTLGDIKDWLFANPEFNGAVNVPTALAGTANNRAASTEFVSNALSDLSLNPATDANFGTVKTDLLDNNPTVYLRNTTDTLLNAKADTTSVNSALALKADTTSVNSALALKADTTSVNSGLALKADTTSVNSGLALKADLDSPAFVGTPTAPTQTAGNNTTRIATTAFVQSKANILSPALTGTPTAPTAAVNTDTTQLATTAFVRRDFIRPYTESAETTYALSSTINIAHGLGVVPKDWHIIFRCITASDGFAVGDEIPGMEFEYISTTLLYGYQSSADATNIVLSTTAVVPLILHKTTKVGTQMTPAHWRVVARWR